MTSASPITGRAPGLLPALRYVLVYGRLWLCLLAVLGCYVAVMLTRGSPWRGDLIWTIDWLSIGFVLSGPLVSGFVAVDTSRLARGVRELALPRGRTFDLAVALTYALTLAALHVAVIAVIVVISRPPAVDWAAPVAVLAQVAMVAFFIALGSLVGRFAPTVLGGLGAALAALVAVYLFSTPRSPAGLLYAGAATNPRIGYDYNALWLAVQVLALATLVAASWIVRPGSRRTRTRVLLTGASAVAVAVVGGAALWAVPGERLEPNGATPDACGSLAGVPWCYYPEHERAVGLYADELMALFETAHANGYPELVPDRVIEADQRTWPSDATTGAFYVTPEALTGQRPETWEVAIRLVEPVHCPQLQGDLPPGEAYGEDLTALTATWVGLVDPASVAATGYTGEPLAPESAQELVHQFRTCTYPFA